MSSRGMIRRTLDINVVWIGSITLDFEDGHSNRHGSESSEDGEETHVDTGDG